MIYRARRLHTSTSDELIADEPWLEIERLCESGDTAGLTAFLGTLPRSDLGLVLSRLEGDERRKVLAILGTETAAEILEQISLPQATDLLTELPPSEAAAIVEEMWSADQADLLSELSGDDAEAILKEMDPEEALRTRELLAYAAESAGGLMRGEFLAYSEDATVGDVIEDLRDNAAEYADYPIQYAYVVTADERLIGVLRMRDLFFAPRRVGVSGIMIRQPLSVTPETTLDELHEFFAHHSFLGVPVVGPDRHIVGVVDRSAVREAEGERAEEDFLKAAGIVGGEEIRTLPMRVRSARRLSWLSANIVLNVVSASVIALYEDTLRSVIALAVFLPIISDMSGCSGNQAVTVSIRELSLGLVKPNEIRRVLLKEAGVGVINGLVLGLFLGLLAFLWKGNTWLGVVVGGSLAVNTTISVLLGGSLPLILKGMGRDPALASAPILTTVTDLMGFLTALGFATLLLSRLV